MSEIPANADIPALADTGQHGAFTTTTSRRLAALLESSRSPAADEATGLGERSGWA